MSLNIEQLKIIIIGSGISGLVSACYLRKQGHQVLVLEKNSSPGGRARTFSANGFHFDMGPSWYWMPEVFEAFYNDFGYTAKDFYELKRISPSYDVFFEKEKIEIPTSMDELATLFEKYEKGSGVKLVQYLKDASIKYQLGMGDFAQKPALSLSEFMNLGLLKSVHKLQPFRNMEEHVNRYFTHPYLRKIMQFPVIFLGAMPNRIPAMYSLMNYADTCLGTWYPMGGMYKIVEAVFSIANELGVQFEFNQDVKEITVKNGFTERVLTDNHFYEADVVIGAGDYHHMEQLLSTDHRQYDNVYWKKKEMAPSSILYYVGVNKKLPIHHHSLFFDTSFDDHANKLYALPDWPKNPLFYVCAPSVTDHTVAPEGHENLFLLIPVAAGLRGDTSALRDSYFDNLIERLEKRLNTSIKPHIVFKQSFGITDFEKEYHAYKGNAYGMANTLLQTAFGKPRMKSSKVKNLFFCGQLTVPGPGLPPAFLSGKMVAAQVNKYINQPAKSPL